MLQIAARPALRQEQQFARLHADARVVEVDMHRRPFLGVAAVAGDADREGSALLERGDVAAGPARAVEEQVLVQIEAGERHGLHPLAFRLAEQDREFALHGLEFGGEDQNLVGGIAEFRAVAEGDAQVLVEHIVQRDRVRHSKHIHLSGHRARFSRTMAQSRRPLNPPRFRRGNGKGPLHQAATLPLHSRKAR